MAPRRLHLFTMVRGINPRVFLQFIPAVVVLGSPLGGLPRSVQALAAVVALAAVAVLRFVAYQRHTYELTGGELVERRGILSRRERTVQLERLQQVEVDQTIVDRLVGTAVLRLETASDASEAELELKVVALEEAQRLRALLLPRSAGDAAARGVPVNDLVHVPLSHVALASVTGRRLLLIPVVIGGAVGLVGDLGLGQRAEDLATNALTAFGVLTAALTIIAVLVISTLVALVAGVLRDGDFRIREVGDDLHIRRGLLATREAVVPRARLQKVTIDRGWLRQRLGYASLTLHSAGGGGKGPGDDSANERQLTVPLIPGDAAVPLLRSLLLEGGELPELEGHPDAARRRSRFRYLRAWSLPVPVVVAATWIWFHSPLQAILAGVVVLVLAAVAGWLLGGVDHRNRASGMNERWVTARSGALSVTEAVSPRDKAQGATISSNPFQRRFGLATLDVHVAGPGRVVKMLDLGADVASRLRDRLDGTWALPGAPTTAPPRTGPPPPPRPSLAPRDPQSAGGA